MFKSYRVLSSMIVATFLIGCATQVVPLVGNYSDVPYAINSTKPVDTVWSNIIDLFATKGLAIKIIDKSSGLITSEETRLTFTTEDYSGNLNDKSAFVVVTKMSQGGITYSAQTVTGEWNIRVKPNEGGTLINVNLVNIKGYYQNTPLSPFTGKSTGVFEKTIADIIK